MDRLIQTIMDECRRGGFALRVRDDALNEHAEIQTWLRDCEAIIMAELLTMPDTQLRALVADSSSDMIRRLLTGA